MLTANFVISIVWHSRTFGTGLATFRSPPADSWSQFFWWQSLNFLRLATNSVARDLVVPAAMQGDVLYLVQTMQLSSN